MHTHWTRTPTLTSCLVYRLRPHTSRMCVCVCVNVYICVYISHELIPLELKPELKHTETEAWREIWAWAMPGALVMGAGR
jgi:hypothetical protein